MVSIITPSSLTIKASAPYVLLSHIHSPNLTYIDLSSINLRENIRSSITMLYILQVLILSSNQLKGEIPFSIGDLISLKNLSLDFNSFSGSVLYSLSTIPGGGFKVCLTGYKWFPFTMAKDSGVVLLHNRLARIR
ncbi:hypothetical protein VNO80_03351 [Phaseolus coccineus]|uniref:Uncharacterized protein n=1 Tax=Phaseolus coccineus TaxID=3886 RepID=A0AAN9RME7_PHACN